MTGKICVWNKSNFPGVAVSIHGSFSSPSLVFDGEARSDVGDPVRDALARRLEIEEFDNDAPELEAVACRDEPPFLAIGVTVLRDGR